jgi:hypothetical protein
VHHNKVDCLMSALGQKQTSDCRPLMSALPPKADIEGRRLDVRFVPEGDISAHSITSSEIASTPDGMVKASALAPICD